MCLAVPGKIVELTGDNALVEIQGIKRAANVTFITDAQVGDYVLLHAGFAIEKWSEEDVKEYNDIISEAFAMDAPPDTP